MPVDECDSVFSRGRIQLIQYYVASMVQHNIVSDAILLYQYNIVSLTQYNILSDTILLYPTQLVMFFNMIVIVVALFFFQLF